MRRLSLLTTAALVAATLATPVLAQQGQPDASRTQSATGGNQSSKQPHLISLRFAGGTVSDLVDELKAGSRDRPVNIIYSTEAASIPIPPFEVRDAELYSTIQSLSYASSGSPTTLEDGRVVSWEIGRVGDGVYSVSLNERPRMMQQGYVQAGPRQKQTAVHSISELTTGTSAMSADDVLSAIQAALAIEGADDETKISFHEETGLIFARVTPDQGGVIEQTLSNLQLSMQARAHREQHGLLEHVLEVAEAKDANELINKLMYADDLRNRVLELQRLNAEQQDYIIELQEDLSRMRGTQIDRRRKEGEN